MKPILVVLGIAALAIVAVAGGGLMLPEVRQNASGRLIAAPSHAVRDLLLDVSSQAEWRRNIASVTVSDQGWAEHTRDGEAITFRILEQTARTIRFEFASSRGYTGTWTGHIVPIGAGETRLEISERVSTPSPVGRILSRLFFDPDAFADRYLDELESEAIRRTRVAAHAS
ncbi:MAG TPA: SRPBCC family protein [Pseudoxanthomonas sp.]|nr:SRPBCC family protein [Pseudoxanthomonas sp.]